MSWWNLPDSKTAWTGEPPADDACDLLAPLTSMSSRPTADGVLDALEVALRDGALVSDEPLLQRTLQIRERPRHRVPGQAALVETLWRGIPQLVASYRKEFHRLPTLRELVYSLSFEFASGAAEYTSGDAGELDYIQVAE
jgi:hypothetical protein